MASIWKCLIVLLFYELLNNDFTEAVNPPLFVCSDNDCWNKQCESITSCPEGRVVERGDICGCCDLCVKYLAENMPCMDEVILGNAVKTECAPGLMCKDKYCAPGTSTCVTQQRNHDEALKRGEQMLGILRPDCDVLGRFSPKQCLGTWCFCVNEQGSRIFGQALLEDSQDMNCECARAFDEFDKASLKGELELRCQSNGNFESLQCLGDKCFCLNPKGEVEEWTELELKWNITCFQNSSNEANLTQCQQERVYMDELEEYEKVQGITMLVHRPSCDPDGSYHRKQCNNTNCFCVGKNAEIIENFVIDIFDADEMRCDCGRDDYENPHALDQSAKCDSKGNYAILQCLGSTCYCGDENGHRTTNHTVHIWELELLNC